MNLHDDAPRSRLACLPREALEQHQVRRLNQLLARILPTNEFYRNKLAGLPARLESLDELSRWPFTYKEELLGPHQSREVARNHTYTPDRYLRFHQTSGTRGWPLVVLDTAEDWQWWVETWQSVLDAAELAAGERVMLAFSFGPYIGFWSAHDAALARGCMVIPGGGMSSLARLEMIRAGKPTALFCTPSYALHLAEVAQQHQLDPRGLGVRRLILAGEPGGSIPATRAAIESAWNARVLDHAGATEVGPWGVGVLGQPGLHVIESEFIAEFLSLEQGGAAAEGELAELVLTTLGRAGAPVLRYRTGDVVRARRAHDHPTRFVWLEGGILGRVDDMLVIRGVNIYPTAIEQIVRGFPEIVEYRLLAHTEAEMDRLTLEIEDRLEQPRRVAEELQLRLGLKVDVHCVPLRSLPRFEGKGRRLVDQRQRSPTPRAAVDTTP